MQGLLLLSSSFRSDTVCPPPLSEMILFVLLLNPLFSSLKNVTLVLNPLFSSLKNVTLVLLGTLMQIQIMLNLNPICYMFVFFLLSYVMQKQPGMAIPIRKPSSR